MSKEDEYLTHYCGDVHVILKNEDFGNLLLEYKEWFNKNLDDRIFMESTFENCGENFIYFMFKDVFWYTAPTEDIGYVHLFITNCDYYEIIVIGEDNEYEVCRSDEDKSHHFIEPNVTIRKNWSPDPNFLTNVNEENKEEQT